MAWSLGCSSAVTSLAFMERRTILSDANHWMPSMTAAMTMTNSMGTPRPNMTVTKKR